MRPGTTRMHDAFGYALVIEVHDLFTQNMVFKQGRATRAGT